MWYSNKKMLNLNQIIIKKSNKSKLRTFYRGTGLDSSKSVDAMKVPGCPAPPHKKRKKRLKRDEKKGNAYPMIGSWIKNIFLMDAIGEICVWYVC